MKETLFALFIGLAASARAGLINPDGYLWLPNFSLSGEVGGVHDIQDVQFDELPPFAGHARELLSQGQHGDGGLEVRLPAATWLTLHASANFGKSQQQISQWYGLPNDARSPDDIIQHSFTQDSFKLGAKFYPFEWKPSSPAVWGINANPSGRYWRPQVGLEWDNGTQNLSGTRSDSNANTIGTDAETEGQSSYALQIEMPFYNFALSSSYFRNYQRSRAYSSHGQLVLSGFSGFDTGDYESYEIEAKAYFYDPAKLAAELPDWNPDGVVHVFSLALWTGWIQASGHWGGNSAGARLSFPISSYLTASLGYSYESYPQPFLPNASVANFATTSYDTADQYVSLGLNIYWPDHDPVEEEHPAYVAGAENN